MDIKAFLKLLNRYKWILIIVPLIAVTVTYFLVRKLPKTYSSEAKIATGIIDPSKQVAGTQDNSDWFKTTNQFNNIIEKMKMRKIMSILSYNLILHDLENPKAAFKPNSEKIDSLSAADKQNVIAEFRQQLLLKAPVSPFSEGKTKYQLANIIASMGYDDVSVNKDLEIAHQDNSDFVNVKYTSDNPFLSAFVVNTLTTEFINNFGLDVDYNQNQSNQVLDSLLKVKQRDMDQKNASLKDFKTKNGVLNLDKQSEMVYQQITQAEDKKAQVIRDLQSNQGALRAIDARLRSADPNMGKNVVADNAEVLNVRNQIELANRRYIDGGFKLADKKKVDSLTAIQVALTSRNSDKYVVDPQVSRQNLLQRKYELETTVAQLSASVSAIDRELATARSKYNAMVPFDAGIQNYVRDADVATKDYLEALGRFNETQTAQNISMKLQIAQIGLPGKAESSKAIIYVAGSGVASFVICLSVLIVLFLMDNSIYTALQLASATKSKVLGSINFLPELDKNIKSIWNESEDNTNFGVHKDLLRSLRFEVASEMAQDDSRILGITSLEPGEGKTFVASNLAYAFAMTGKKVLLIAGDEKTQQVASGSKQLTTSQNFETFLAKREIQVDDLITRLNKIEEHKSLLEIQNEKNLASGFDILKKQFDIIIIDVNSLSTINLAKEWLSFTERNFIVFESGRALTDEDKSVIFSHKNNDGFMGFVLNKIKLAELNNN
ncbi:Lipopolysaccharide biosynthesis [Pedobacter sp. BAL39]|uniref:exopolysaccharide transport family protein n=1 Tax=Pedobacter sp. BAL39 TaxID=391596 RepID=UPI00015594B7|nr:AAA family ATPase [Pedobacter sp. BAL39]EDM38229.1 Lipopolysaccharide biosynthesis [Pedobacter sp. BAL39]